MPDVIMGVDAAFAPRPGGQQAFFKDHTNKYIFVHGGWGSGKTYIGARKFLDGHVYNAFDEAGQPTGVKSAMLAPTSGGIMDYQMPAMEEACSAMNIKPVYKRFFNGMQNVLYLPDLSSSKVPSLVICRTAERPELITGWEVGIGWGDEASRWKVSRDNPRNDPYIQFLGRIRCPLARMHRAFFTYTNEGDTTRVYEEATSGKPGYAHYNCRTADNPSVRDFYESQRRILTAEMAEQYLEGGVMRISGGDVYREFDATVHVVDSLELDPALPVDISFDFNINPGMHCVIGQYHPGHDYFGVRWCITGRDMNVIDCTRLALRRVLSGDGKLAYPALRVFGDTAGNSRSPKDGQSSYALIQQIIEAAGIKPHIKVKRGTVYITDRVNATNAALRDLDGNPHIAISREGCPVLIRDLERVKYDKHGVPDKSSDVSLTHASEALSFWIEYLRPCRLQSNLTPGRFGV